VENEFMSLEKAQLITSWMNLYINEFSFAFCTKGERIDSAAVQNSITKTLEGKGESECIYLLCIINELDYVPIYIGKSKTPANRWRSHIKNLFDGKASYARWKSFLLENDVAKHNCLLIVVPVIAISEPPISGFPKTIGSIEYQLVSLASDAYPDTLLNHEGNRR
jgi:hypothetical protein